MTTARTWSLLGALLLLTAGFAGCTKDADDPADGGGTGGTDTGGTGGAGGTGGTGGTGGGAPPQDFTLEDSGTIQGPFSQTWEIEVQNVAFRSASVHFELSGVQAGAPPTARVNLALLDPDGATVMSGVAGVGGSDVLSWTLTPAELSQSGTYTLTATAGSDAPAPSVGLADYQLHAEVLY